MRKALLIGIIVIVILAAALYFVPITVSYEAQEPYEVLEPYEVQEPYQVQVEKELTYSVVRSYGEGGFTLALGAVANAYVTLRNNDAVPGTFVVNFTFTTLRRTFRSSVQAYILPGETKTAEAQADIASGEDWTWSYMVVPGTKMVTETRYRTVTMYKPVTRYKTVTKQKNVRLYEWLAGER